jgi:hypothetical protein
LIESFGLGLAARSMFCVPQRNRALAIDERTAFMSNL